MNRLMAFSLALQCSGLLAAQCMNVWQPVGAPPGTDATVLVVTLWDLDGPGPAPAWLVAGGSFTTAGAIAADHVAAWDPASGAWMPLGSGTNGSVHALAVLPGGDLVVGGAFTSAGGAAASHVARWDGSAWSALGAGTDDVVRALAVLANGVLVAGGDFTTAGACAASHVARWDGASWSALGSGTNGSVHALTGLTTGELVAGGVFTTAGGGAAKRVARWDGVAWSGMSGGMNGAVYCLMSRAGQCVAGGGFTTAGRALAPGIARWTGSAWGGMGSGVQGAVHALAALPDGDVVAGGSFLQAGGIAAAHIARFDGASWHPFGSGADDHVLGLVFAPAGGLFVAGDLATAGGIASPRLARLTTTCPADVQALGVGCPGSGGSNTLTAARPWAGGAWGWQVTGMPANALALIALGFATTAQPLALYVPSPSGCVLHVQPDVGFALGPVAGAMAHTAPLPNTTGIAGIAFHLQVLPVDLAGPLQVTASNAVTVTVGAF